MSERGEGHRSQAENHHALPLSPRPRAEDTPMLGFILIRKTMLAGLLGRQSTRLDNWKNDKLYAEIGEYGRGLVHFAEFPKSGVISSYDKAYLGGPGDTLTFSKKVNLTEKENRAVRQQEFSVCLSPINGLGTGYIREVPRTAADGPTTVQLLSNTLIIEATNDVLDDLTAALKLREHRFTQVNPQSDPVAAKLAEIAARGRLPSPS
jgi:hypothetical protein